MKNAYKLFFGTVLLFLNSGLAAQTTPTPKHLADARRLLQDLKPADTSYRHKDTVVKWRGENGATQCECHTDCSGFLDSLIHHSYPQFKADDFKKWFGVKRPLAHHYYNTIVANKGFTSIRTIAAVHPGDIIAIKYPPGNANTGHTLLINGRPTPRKASAPLIDGTQQWELPIIDASTSGHGKSDTRRQADGTFRGGMGAGIFRIYTSSDGALRGYSWSVLSGSEFHDIKNRPVIIGRLDSNHMP
jgi:hypothetical protein